MHEQQKPLSSGGRDGTGAITGQLTRRHFLQALGAVGGAGMLMSGLAAFNIGIASAQDRPPPSPVTVTARR
nr:twin-arginine translocation signal domain-containing protein [Halomonas socia]